MKAYISTIKSYLKHVYKELEKEIKDMYGIKNFKVVTTVSKSEDYEISEYVYHSHSLISITLPSKYSLPSDTYDMIYEIIDMVNRRIDKLKNDISINGCLLKTSKNTTDVEILPCKVYSYTVNRIIDDDYGYTNNLAIAATIEFGDPSNPESIRQNLNADDTKKYHRTIKSYVKRYTNSLIKKLKRKYSPNAITLSDINVYGDYEPEYQDSMEASFSIRFRCDEPMSHKLYNKIANTIQNYLCLYLGRYDMNVNGSILCKHKNASDEDEYLDCVCGDIYILVKNDSEDNNSIIFQVTIEFWC